MKATLQTQPGTGTPYGMGFYQTLLDCAVKAATQHALGPSRYQGASGKKALDTGSVYHTYQQLYREQGMDLQLKRIKLPRGWDADHIAEATRLFKAYRLQLPPNYWGKIVAIERAMPEFWWDKKAGLWMVDPKQGPIASEAVGAAGLPVTGRPDLVVKISKRDATRIFKFHGIIVEPGYWIIDYKTAGRIDGQLFQYYELSIQFRVYPLIWNALYPKQKVRGVIADVITKEKEPQLHAIKVPLRERLAERATTAFFDNVRSVMANDNWRNLSNPSKCVHWRDGRCSFYKTCKYAIA